MKWARAWRSSMTMPTPNPWRLICLPTSNQVPQKCPPRFLMTSTSMIFSTKSALSQCHSTKSLQTVMQLQGNKPQKSPRLFMPSMMLFKSAFNPFQPKKSPQTLMTSSRCRYKTWTKSSPNQEMTSTWAHPKPTNSDFLKNGTSAKKLSYPWKRWKKILKWSISCNNASKS